MARQHIVPMGKHKPVRSSWAAMDTGAYTRSYEPESRPEFQCYITGQYSNMQAVYEQAVKRQQIEAKLARLKEMGLA